MQRAVASAEQWQHEREQQGGVAPAAASGLPAAEQQWQQRRGSSSESHGGTYQRKITPLDQSLAVAEPWSAALGLPSLAAAGTAGEGSAPDAAGAALRGAYAARASGAAAPPRQQLVVVASLLDKIPNLAGQREGPQSAACCPK